MAHVFPYFDNLVVTDQIKTLPNEELLDFWEETQFIDKYLEVDIDPKPIFSLEYERAVLKELQIRSCLGRLKIS